MKNKLNIKRKFKIPTSFTILFMVLVTIMVISWILNLSGITYVNGETTEKIKAIGIVDLFVSIFIGFEQKLEIIVFVMAIGAFIYIVMKSKSLDALTQKIAWKFKDKTIWAIPIIVVFLSFCGSAYGMSEEAIGFHMIVIPLMLVAGFDIFTALMTVLLGGGIGPMLATFDPFLIFTASDAANMGEAGISEPMEGIIFRFAVWVLVTLFTCVYIMLYARKVKNNPQLSYTFSTLEEDKKFFLKEQVNQIPLTKKRIAINIMFLLMFLIMIVYLIPWDTLAGGNWFENSGNWVNKYMPFLTSLVPGLGLGSMYQVAGFFLIGSLIVAILNWEGEEAFVEDALNGVKDITGVAFIIAMAGAVTYLLIETGMQSLMLTGISNSNTSSMNPFLFIVLTFFLFIPMSFALPSSSGFSSAVFPVWGPLANTITTSNNISMVSGSITAFAFANGMANMVSPASGIVVGAAQIGRIDYGKLMKGTWKFHVSLLVLNTGLLLIGTGLNYTGVHIF
ncbi:YfcC family protein [Spiroplasma diminutum]|uniref:Arginine/ornithine antiporter n=1 Tax=Spiroplasma diminutum CUAS-1 TaxID=1276221 RepID=S5LVN2_9MOLU|nr:YfcC family protein [Spiroplasma diminutum]AGR41894.1 arginine/ornithine antiporter [Spiroplasma diminutum CUAS-1]